MNMSLCRKYVIMLWQTKSRAAAEFSWSVFNFQKEQDVRLKLGYEVLEKVYFWLKLITETQNMYIFGALVENLQLAFYVCPMIPDA